MEGLKEHSSQRVFIPPFWVSPSEKFLIPPSQHFCLSVCLSLSTCLPACLPACLYVCVYDNKQEILEPKLFNIYC